MLTKYQGGKTSAIFFRGGTFQGLPEGVKKNQQEHLVPKQGKFIYIYSYLFIYLTHFIHNGNSRSLANVLR